MYFYVRYCTDLTKVRGVSRGEVVFAGKNNLIPMRATGAIYTYPNHLTWPFVAVNAIVNAIAIANANAIAITIA